MTPQEEQAIARANEFWRNLEKQADMAEAAADFIRSDFGQFFLNKIEEERDAAMVALLNANPGSPQEIMAAQVTARAINMAANLFDEIVKTGAKAAEILSNAQRAADESPGGGVLAESGITTNGRIEEQDTSFGGEADAYEDEFYQR